MNAMKIGIAGLGTVGGGVAKGLRAHGEKLDTRAGMPLELVAVCDRDASKRDAFDAPVKLDDIKALVASKADLIVELIGGENGAAPFLVEEALKAGKHVVTANKAMMARHGAKLAALAPDRDEFRIDEALDGAPVLGPHVQVRTGDASLVQQQPGHP